MKPTTAQAILTKVKKDYNDLADNFDVTRINTWPEFDMFEPYIKSGMEILDIGCGNGRLIETLKHKKIFYSGIDISEKLIEKAKKKYPDHFFQTGDILNLDFEAEKFDVIFLVATLNHVPSEKLRRKAISEAHKILKPGGYLLMTNWNLYQTKYKHLIWKHRIQSILQTKDLDKGDVFVPWRNPDGELLQKRYYHAFTLSELKKLAEKFSFKIAKQYYSLKGNPVSKARGYNTLSVWQKK